MKKLGLGLLLLVFVSLSVLAVELIAVSSGEKTADAAVYTGQGYLTGLQVMTDGTNVATAVVYDNTAASGKVICEISLAGTTRVSHRSWTAPVYFKNGLYVDITGTGASYIIEYKPQQ